MNGGDAIELGGTALRFVTGKATAASGGHDQPAQEPRVIELQSGSLTLGRDPSNAVVLDDPNVSRFHAVLNRVGDSVELADLGSRNGTRLNHELISTRAVVSPGSEIGIGPFRLVFDGTRFPQRRSRCPSTSRR